MWILPVTMGRPYGTCLIRQNIGGIGNVTILPRDCTLDQVTAFDTGPGNMLIDAFISRMTAGREYYGREYLDRICKYSRAQGITDVDCLRTITQ